MAPKQDPDEGTPREQLNVFPGPQGEPAPEHAAASTEDASAAQEGGRAAFPVVGIGASAGGLDAFKRFLIAMPADSGMAFVLIPHLAPTHESLMVELLSKHTHMPVCEAAEGMGIDPNRVYIIPPNKYLAVRNGALHLSKPIEPRGLQTAIDFSLRSLADDRRHMAIGIVLSGTGSHGALGLQAVKAAGGIAMVQTPETAEYDRMPLSAIATGVIDYVLPVEKMPAALLRYVHHAQANGVWKAAAISETGADDLNRILSLLRAQAKYDFRSYRKKMLMRRVRRRMSLSQLEDLPGYLQMLRENGDEVQQLCRDLLIGVTGFFREPAAFAVLEQQVMPELVRRNEADAPIRLWVPGCATGEEAYSLVMLLIEQCAAVHKPCNVQVFATDIDQQALEVARQGIYPASIAGDIPAARFQRFFVQADEHHYHVSNQLRESVVFAPQNLIGDAPFSKIDLISCRNLLIYLEPDVQTKIISLFHFALSENGYLVLGPSETIGRQVDLFDAVSGKWRIFRRLAAARRDIIDFPIVAGGHRHERSRTGEPPPPRPVNVAEITRQLLLDAYAPASVLINRRHEILYLFGPTDKYLDLPTGEPTLDLIAMARQGLRTKLRSACLTAITDHKPVKVTDTQVKRDGAYVPVTVTIKPTLEPKAAEGLLLVTFQDRAEAPAVVPAAAELRVDESSVVQQLEYELKSTREDLQSTIEEMDSANEELKASNEEIMSMNEELQSANEELETSKEELQSLNEELSTVNSQLQDKVEDLEALNNDITNLLISTDIATLFLDTQLRIKRFTPAIGDLLSLIATDVGRSVSHFSRNFTDEHLLVDARNVLDNLVPVEREVLTLDRRCHLRRILPYRTHDNRIEGVAITFVDITERKRAEELLRDLNDQLEDRVRQRTSELAESNRQLQEQIGERHEAEAGRAESERRLRAMVEHVPAVVYTAALDETRTSLYVSPQVERLLGFSVQDHAADPDLWRKRLHAEDLPRVMEQLSRTGGSGRFDAEYRMTTRDDRTIWVEDHAVNVALAPGQPQVRQGIIVDITMRKQLEEQLMAYQRNLRSLAAEMMLVEERERKRLGQDLHDGPGQNLAVAKMKLTELDSQARDTGLAAGIQEVRERIDAALRATKTLTFELSPPVLHELGLSAGLHWLGEQMQAEHGLRVVADDDGRCTRFDERVTVVLYRALRELLLNVVKHAESDEVTVTLRREDRTIRLVVQDQGRGFDVGHGPQAILSHPGRGGFGLFSIRERLAHLGGSLDVQSEPGSGTTVTLTATLPVEQQKEEEG